jgi:hypothetical protein
MDADTLQKPLPKDLENQTGTIDSFPQGQLFDFASVLASVDVEVLRLGWDALQFQYFLESTYSKRSRSLLADKELMDLLDRLKRY